MIELHADPPKAPRVAVTLGGALNWFRQAWDRTSGGNPWLLTGALVLCAIVALPILTVLSNIFATSNGTLGHLARTILPGILFNTIGLLLLVGIGTAVIGTGCAWLVTMYKFPLSSVFAWLLMLPMAMPAYIIGYAYTDFLTFAGPLQSGLRAAFGWTRDDYWFPNLQSLWGVSLMLTLVLYPYVYFLTRSAFLDQSLTALDVARTLGHSGRDRFFKVALPLARPSIAAGLALALMETLADLGTVQYFGIDTFTTAIYRTWFGMGDRIAAGKLASGLLLFVAILVVLEQWARRQSRFHTKGRKQWVISRTKLTGWRSALAVAACVTPVLLGFLVPVAILLGLHFEGGDNLFGTRFLRLAWNTFSLAGVAAVIVTAAGLFVAYTLRLATSERLRSLLRLATFGYALPGTVIAVGILVSLGAIDRGLDGAFRSVFGISTGLLLSGSIAALLFAYLVRFLAVAVGGLEAGFGRIPESMDQVARTLGCTSGEVMRRVHLPLLSRPLMTASVLVFVDVLKELPATLIIRPFNFDTLAVRVYQLAADERLAEASTGALVIVSIGLLSVGLLASLVRGAKRSMR
ncbi:MAG: iron ABC transporter permease [Hyphomicrobiaceae bacterium]